MFGPLFPNVIFLGLTLSPFATLSRFAHVTKKPKGLNWEYQVTEANAGWPL
jgi:hypothetical protein